MMIFEHVNLFHKHMNLRNIVCKASNSINMILMAAYSQHVVLMPEVIANQLLGKIPIKLFTPPPELQMIYECFIHYHKSYAEEKNHFRYVAITLRYFFKRKKPPVTRWLKKGKKDMAP